MSDVKKTKTKNDVWEEICGPIMTREEVLHRLKDYPEAYKEFRKLSKEFQEEFVAYSMGVKGVKMTYDPFFKTIFDPDKYKRRLEDFLEACLGEPVKIEDVVKNESERLTDDGGLLIEDLVVRLKSGELVNVEMQRVGYYFPGERCACYSSDLIMRQYSQLKAQMKGQKQRFPYGMIKKVFTIVLMYKSTEEFQRFPEDHLHYAKQTFQTGLNVDLMQEYLLIPLDIFLKNNDNIISKLDAWLYFIASDKMEDIKRVCEAYPEFKELYQDVFKFRYQPKELVSMFSEALRMLDKATEQYMIDDLMRKNEELKEKNEELKEKNEELKEKNEELKEKNEELKGKNEELKEEKAQRKALEAKVREQEEMLRKLQMERAGLETPQL